MVKTTPFHPRTAALNETLLWEHWMGYASAIKYQFSEKIEYYAIRNAVALFDTSPLFKYRFKGADAERYLMGVLARDVRRCRPGRAQYTIWCDDKGHLLEDGLILRIAPDEYWLTTARPNLRYFQNLISRHNLTISDISHNYGILALQGPHATNVLNALTPQPIQLPYFGVTQSHIANKPVTISRTGFTGDLGYEIWIETPHALAVWDALMATGRDYNITPIGVTALSMARIEAGLLLIEIDFESARHAWVADQRDTPHELGLGWMFSRLAQSDRSFIGRRAIEQEIANQSSRHQLVGFELDWQSYEQTYHKLGLIAPKDHIPIEEAMSLYNADQSVYLGYATSFTYSPILKKHIGLAKVPLNYTRPGSPLHLEIMINHKPHYILAHTTPLPFYNPPQKTNK